MRGGRLDGGVRGGGVRGGYKNEVLTKMNHNSLYNRFVKYVEFIPICSYFDDKTY